MTAWSWTAPETCTSPPTPTAAGRGPIDGRLGDRRRDGAQQGITNVAFGGTDHKTLYLTAQGTGNNGPVGLFKISMPLPGMPY